MSDRLMRRTAWSAIAISALLIFGIAIYGYAIRLPFLLDDTSQLQWIQAHGFEDIWSSRLIAYFRPIQASVWKALLLAQGGLDAPTLHFANIASHAVNGVLMWGVLSLRARQPRTPGEHIMPFAAAALFLLYPFSYQAIPWVGSLAHPLVLTVIQSSLLLGLLARKHRSRMLWLGSLGFAAIAPFVHETGGLVAPLMLLLFITDESAAHAPRILTSVRQSLPYWACSLVGAVIVLAMNRAIGYGSTFSLNLESRYQNGVYFLQGLAYPIAPLATRLQDAGPGLNDLQSILIVCFPIILALAAMLSLAGCRKLVILSLGWFFIGVAPAWLMLGFDYVIDGPRLLYQASVGAATFWALPLAAQWHSRRGRPIGTALAVILIIVVAAGSSLFLSERADMYQQAQRATSQLAQAIPPNENQTTILVNFPEWLAPRHNTFAIGHEGVPIVPGYASMYDYFLINTGRKAYIETVVLEDAKREWRHGYLPFGTVRSAEDIQSRLRNARRLIMTDLSTPNVLVYDAGGLTATNTLPATDFIASYDNKLTLVTDTYTLEDSVLKVTLIWQSWSKLPQETNTFIHVQMPDGTLVAQTDGFPVANVARPSYWQPGDQWCETRLVPLPRNLKDGTYTLRIGAYPVAGGPRLPARGSRGEHFDNDSVLIGLITIHG